jgi:hypothetical protein
VTETFLEHSNWQRPHQGHGLGNQPPRMGHPELPALPPVPDVVNGVLPMQHPQLRRTSFPLKGLQRQALPYQSYLELMLQEAAREQRLLALQKRRGYLKGKDTP